MSGWIKFWKDMPNDPRVLAAAMKLSERYILAHRCGGGGADLSKTEMCNAWRNAVTGALATLWCYADEHIRDDDSLPLTSQTLDTIVGLEGFFDVMPREWIDELEDGSIILPGYCEKNSLIAKRKRTIKSNARVTQWRRSKKSKGNGVTRIHVTQHNAAGDLDQDRDQDKEEKNKNGNHAVVPTDVSAVFDFWKQEHRHPRAQLDERREKLIRGALAKYSAQDLCRAIGGYKHSPHHMGQNDRKTVYDDIEIFLRDAKHIDAGLKFAEQGSQVSWQ